MYERRLRGVFDYFVYVWINIVKFFGLFMLKLIKFVVKGLRK